MGLLKFMFMLDVNSIVAFSEPLSYLHVNMLGGGGEQRHSHAYTYTRIRKHIHKYKHIRTYAETHIYTRFRLFRGDNGKQFNSMSCGGKEPSSILLTTARRLKGYTQYS